MFSILYTVCFFHSLQCAAVAMVITVMHNISPPTVGCLSLTWLNIAHNNLETLKGVQSLINLVGETVIDKSMYYKYNST